MPAQPHTVAFGVTRQVEVNTPMVNYEYGSYSVPHQLRGQTVWVRVHGAGRDERVIIVHVGEQGPVEGGPASADRTGHPPDRRRAIPAGSARAVAPGTPAGRAGRHGIPRPG
jgi:hypothetical protein